MPRGAKRTQKKIKNYQKYQHKLSKVETTKKKNYKLWQTCNTMTDALKINVSKVEYDMQNWRFSTETCQKSLEKGI